MAFPVDLFDLLFLEADAIAGADNDAVTSWPDSSAANNDAGQAVAGNKPTYKVNILNGQPVVRFDGGDFLTLGSVLSPTACTVVIVFVPTSTITSASAAQALLARNSSTDPRGFVYLGAVTGVLTGEVIAWVNINTGLIKGVANNANISGANLFTFTLTGTTELIYKNGTSVANLTSTDGGLDSAGTDRFINVDSIGAANGASFFSGDIAMIGVASSVLSDANRHLLGGYIQTKYGITVAGATFAGVSKKLISAYMRSQ